MTKYKIVRFFERGKRRTINTGLTLEQAQEHCNDPKTSSRTCTPARAKSISKGRGAWFDGYEEDK